LLTILSAFSDTEIPALEERFVGAGYGDLKKEVAAAYLAFAEPFAARANELLSEPDTLDDILADGARRARLLTAPLLAQVYDRVGLIPGKW